MASRCRAAFQFPASRPTLAGRVSPTLGFGTAPQQISPVYGLGEPARSWTRHASPEDACCSAFRLTQSSDISSRSPATATTSFPRAVARCSAHRHQQGRGSGSASSRPASFPSQPCFAATRRFMRAQSRSLVAAWRSSEIAAKERHPSPFTLLCAARRYSPTTPWRSKRREARCLPTQGQPSSPYGGMSSSSSHLRNARPWGRRSAGARRCTWRRILVPNACRSRLCTS